MNQKEILYIAVTIFLTILAWMVFDLNQVRTHITIEKKAFSIQPIDFKIDGQVLRILKDKQP